MSTPIDLKVGLTSISHIRHDEVPTKLPEKSELPQLGEAIDSHFDALFHVYQGQTLVENTCRLSDATCKEIAHLNLFNMPTDTLQWLGEMKKSGDVDAKTEREARAVLNEIAELSLILNISSKLLVQ
ncbi:MULTISPECIES: hypothetical protein [Pseudoalteromonas]|uniref:type III secretion apparatus assembly protein SctX n=1 Tax=Pseudoalteromonas TaxID=53246 RepID=UPI00026CDA1C|nr:MULTISPECIES: hypothetical protein [Pseudoalteromonas]ATD01032.1 hypothetical protein PSPO_b1121 [Pseudoalteromonas spongiae UST010723-006]MCF6455647.1 hypothetical protein [Pseudoalteromonas sp. MMG024]